MRLLLVEDDELLGEGVRNGLIQGGYTVDWFRDGISALQAIRSEKFDMIVLDISLPKMSGLEFLQQIRKTGYTTPVLILTARETVEDRVKGLDSGADDYMIKPFELDELCARLRALQRRFLHRTESKLTYADIILDPAARTVTVASEPISIGRREFTLLEKLMENVGVVISREHLTQTLYGWNEIVDSNAIEVHIHNLRKKIGSNCIRTIRGVGYMLEKLEEG